MATARARVVTLAGAAVLLSAAFSGCVSGPKPAPAAPKGMVVLRPPVARAAPASASQKLTTHSDSYSVEYEFTDSRQERVTLKFEIPKSQLAAADAAWGYNQKDVAAIKERHKVARDAALQEAVKRQNPQDRLDVQVASLQARYDQELKAYLSSRGFRLAEGGAVQVDLPELVKRSVPSVAPAAAALRKVAEAKGYGPSEIIEALLALTQLGVLYVPIPGVVAGTHIGGIWPPLKTLVTGRGDCDSKAGLLAALLAQWPDMRLIGIVIQDHYILGLLREPAEGESYILFKDRKYVLLEAAGPAWLPLGQVGKDAEAEFRAQTSYRIEPLF